MGEQLSCQKCMAEIQIKYFQMPTLTFSFYRKIILTRIHLKAFLLDQSFRKSQNLDTETSTYNVSDYKQAN